MSAPIKITVLKFLLNSWWKPRPASLDNKLKSNCQDEETNMVHLQDGLNIKYLIKKINLTSYLMLTDQKQNMGQGKTNKQTNK